MRLPHHKYLLYLLSTKMSGPQVMSVCASRDLFCPGEAYLSELASSHLGKLPRCWRKTVRRKDVAFRRWLRDKGILPLWERSESVEPALIFQRAFSVRRAFEALYLSETDLDKIRDRLLLRFKDDRVPDTCVLERYRDLFWNLGPMSPAEVYEFLENQGSRTELRPAYEGDLAEAFGILGLRQKVAEADLLRRIIDLTSQQLEHATKEGCLLSGSQQMGLAAMSRQALVACEQLREIGEGGPSSDREGFDDFRLRMRREEAYDIPSIDDLNSDDGTRPGSRVIDVAFTAH